MWTGFDLMISTVVFLVHVIGVFWFDWWMSGAECVVCMCDSRDTIILPCRHLCLCNACADSLRYQANNCPICRAPFRALLQVPSYHLPLLRIRDVYPGSRIQDPNFFHPGSRNPGQQLSHLPRSLQGSSPGTSGRLPVSLSLIQDPGSEFFPSRIQGRSREFKYF